MSLDKKGIIIVHQHFRTWDEGGAVRSFHLAKALSLAGFSVTVIAGPYGKKRREGEKLPFQVVRLPVAYDNSMKFYRRIQSFIRFAYSAYRWISKNAHKDQLLYLITTPLTVPMIGLICRQKYIVEVGDLWPDIPIQMGYIKNPILKMVLRKLEVDIYKNASGIVALSPAISEAIRDKLGSNSSQIKVLPNLAHPDFFASARGSNTGVFTIAYLGAMGAANGLDSIIRLASEVKLPVRWLMMGDGAERDNLINLSQQLGCDNISWLKQGGKEDVRQVLAGSAAVLISYADYPLLATGSPNKFFDGLAAGKLIIMTVTGWMQRLVEQNACGFHFNPKNTADFEAKISGYINDPRRLDLAQQKAFQLANDHFLAENIISENVTFIREKART